MDETAWMGVDMGSRGRGAMNDELSLGHTITAP